MLTGSISLPYMFENGIVPGNWSKKFPVPQHGSNSFVWVFNDRDEIKELTISRKVYEERLEPNQLLLLAPRQPIRFHDTYHGSQIAYEDDGIGIRKIYGEDVEIALVDKAVSVAQNSSTNVVVEDNYVIV